MLARLYFGSRNQIINHIKSEFNTFELVNDVNLNNFKMSYSKFFDSNNIYIHNNPSTNELKTIADFIDSNLGNHILLFEDDSFDGRSSLIQKLKKNNQIYDYSLPIYGDKTKLSSSLKKHNLSYDVLSWIQVNCPTTRIKSKSTGRKDIICYDTDLLEQEILKIQSIKTITVNDLENSEFKSDSDIFQFINDLLDNKIENVFNNYGKLLDHMGEQGLLLVMISQIYFMIRVSDAKNHKNINYLDRVDMKDILGKYYSSDWDEIKYSYQPTNPIRFKLESDRLASSFDRLNSILDLLFEALIDLRSGGSKSHCLPLMFSKIALV
jgi:hypothetical protein